MTDLALRSGLPDAKSFSLGMGLSSMVQYYWSEPTFASKEAMFEKQTDFDADRIQPHLSEYDASEEEEFDKDAPYNPAVDKLDFDKYYRRLEDIDEGYLEAYVSNLVYSICRYTNNGVRAFNKEHMVAPTIIDVEDGSAMDLAELELDVDKNDWSDTDMKKAMSQLPYVLHRFLNLSCYTGIHVLSFVCSYMLAAERNRVARMHGSTKILKKNAVIAENVWTCDSVGNAVKKVEISNKNLHAYELFDWIEGTSSMYVPYRVDVTNFMHYVKVLNLDITEDMSKYGPDFVRSLTVITLTPNSQYNQSVSNALAAGTPVYKATHDRIQKTIIRFNELCMSNDILKEVIDSYDTLCRQRNFDMAKKIHYASIMAAGRIGERADYEFCDGFLYCNGELAYIGCGLITDVLFVDGRVLLSELGYAVAVTDTLVLNLMTLPNALDNVMKKIRATGEKLEGWWTEQL